MIQLPFIIGMFLPYFLYMMMSLFIAMNSHNENGFEILFSLLLFTIIPTYAFIDTLFWKNTILLDSLLILSIVIHTRLRSNYKLIRYIKPIILIFNIIYISIIIYDLFNK